MPAHPIPSATSDHLTLFDRVGGRDFFVELVDRFYGAVENDPVVRPLYPKDLGPGKANLADFLAQYWGGPPDYSARRGHPRLRMRHFPFAIGSAERDAWLRCMTRAVEESGASAADAGALTSYFERASLMLVNRPG